MAKINTIQELEELYYGNRSDGSGRIAKADAPILSTTTGVFNRVFGQFVWATFNQEANTVGILPKTVWDMSGWRLQTARVFRKRHGAAIRLEERHRRTARSCAERTEESRGASQNAAGMATTSRRESDGAKSELPNAFL